MGRESLPYSKMSGEIFSQDARGLFKSEKPAIIQQGRTQRQCWDIEHFNSWRQPDRKVRVARSLETTTVRRQKNKKEEQETSNWIWVTTLSQQRVCTEDVVNLGHGRWDIENKELNEMVNNWDADHVYKHNPVAIEAFRLIIMPAYNLFHSILS